MPIMLLAQQVLGAADAVADTSRKIWRAVHFEDREHEAPRWWQDIWTDIIYQPLPADLQDGILGPVPKTLLRVLSAAENPRVERLLQWSQQYSLRERRSLSGEGQQAPVLDRAAEHTEA